MTDEVWRLFVAIEVPESIVDRLAELGRELDGTRILPGRRAHVTLRFLGDTPGRSVDGLKSALAAVRSPGFELVVKGLGLFARGPRKVLWAGLSESPGLRALKEAVDRALADAVGRPEERRFTPHLTLARLKDARQASLLVKSLADREFGRFLAEEFLLVKSELKPTGAVHANLAGFALD